MLNYHSEIAVARPADRQLVEDVFARFQSGLFTHPEVAIRHEYGGLTAITVAGTWLVLGNATDADKAKRVFALMPFRNIDDARQALRTVLN